MAWPASNAIWIACALSVLSPVVTYVIAVVEGHVEAFLPYVSETGDTPPESTVFTQLMVVAAAFVLLVFHVRFVFVALYFEAHNVENIYLRINQSSVCIGYLICFGLLLLACFQESNAYYIHNVSSLVLVTLGWLSYATLQTILSLRLFVPTGSKVATGVRIIVNALMIVFTSTYFICIVSEWKCGKVECRDQIDRNYRLLGSISDWVLTCLNAAYLMTFYHEFRTVKLTTTKIQVVV